MATKPKSTQHEFEVQARMWVESTITVRANSLEEAVEQSKSLKLEDFITIDGSANDYAIRVTGVFENYVEPKI